ncbi:MULTISPECIES: hypothetical protein [Rhodobacterales]|jgi:hypothetical protein|uniref:Lipoprotein n=1 Tax=Phaeobacter gallaeciensis TaxID=60890 RepID=A0A1B0ZX31_9RHOB|nr:MULTISPECIES: hypothetical protein [Phaeobacter]MDF1772757.1 hypothetical protein [Pseudophaeobacter sp. bin_em_oilr2.035]MEE2632822.1 hypothetical protein [Pseudomonadota bacterium]ANP38763.1 hypothetical protein JL2886_03895 [Phaeobacter gallaeciensis]MDE4061809.1 hypothetical protein [Phaeobacter gallaeciensis]MDE4096236.1 hypothetical protein [Phaeobacter gallaeciensis]
MRKPLSLLLASAIVLAGCGGWRDSRINPSNWFGSSRVAEAPVDGDVNPLIPEKVGNGLLDKPEAEDRSVLIAEVSELRIEKTPTGAIVYATGVASRLGAFDVEMRPVPNDDPAVLEYDFRVVYPEDATAVGSAFSRTLRAAVSLGRQDLAGIRTIRVNGSGNARESRRR